MVAAISVALTSLLKTISTKLEQTPEFQEHGDEDHMFF